MNVEFLRSPNLLGFFLWCSYLSRIEPEHNEFIRLFENEIP